MRSTIHMASRRDFGSSPPRCAPRAATDGAGRGSGPRPTGAKAAAKVERFLADGPTPPRPDREGARVRQRDLVRGAPVGRPRAGASVRDVARPRADLYGLAREWLGEPPDVTEEDAVSTSSAGTSGPSAPRHRRTSRAGRDSHPTAVAALAAMRLRRFRDERGTELVDLPRAPLPDPETPAPVRFLGVWDAILLAHARRTQALPDRHRTRVFNTKMPQSVNTFLVDGRVAGSWRHDDGRIVRSLRAPRGTTGARSTKRRHHGRALRGRLTSQPAGIDARRRGGAMTSRSRARACATASRSSSGRRGHAHGRRQGRDRGGRPEPAPAMVGRAGGTRSFAILVVDPDVPDRRAGCRVGSRSATTSLARTSRTGSWPTSCGRSRACRGRRRQRLRPHGDRRPAGRRRGLRPGTATAACSTATRTSRACTAGGRSVPPVERRGRARVRPTVFALDTPSLGLAPAFTLEEFRAAIEGHVLDEGRIVPTYTLNPSLRRERGIPAGIPLARASPFRSPTAPGTPPTPAASASPGRR